MLKSFKLINLTFYLLCLFVLSCKTKEVPKNNQIDKITIIEKSITKNIYNKEKTLILNLNFFQGKEPIINYNYKILNAITKKELVSGVFSGTHMEWFDNSSIKAFKYVGMVKNEGNEVVEDINIENDNYIIIKID